MLIGAGTRRRKRELRETAIAVAFGANEPAGIDKAFSESTPASDPSQLDEVQQTFLQMRREEE